MIQTSFKNSSVVNRMICTHC